MNGVNNMSTKFSPESRLLEQEFHKVLAILDIDSTRGAEDYKRMYIAGLAFGANQSSANGAARTLDAILEMASAFEAQQALNN